MTIITLLFTVNGLLHYIPASVQLFVMCHAISLLGLVREADSPLPVSRWRFLHQPPHPLLPAIIKTTSGFLLVDSFNIKSISSRPSCRPGRFRDCVNLTLVIALFISVILDLALPLRWSLSSGELVAVMMNIPGSRMMKVSEQ